MIADARIIRIGSKLQQSKTVLVILLLISAGLSALRFDSFQVGAFNDDAHYVVLAESLASGQGQHLINYPDAPAERAFPIGWPLLLAPLVALFPGNYTVLKLLTLILWLASLPLIYRLFCTRMETPNPELLVALVAVNPILGISGMLMSEAAYLFFSLLTITVSDNWNQQKNQVWPMVIVGILAWYTQLIRTVGIAVILAIAIYQLLSKRFRSLGLVVIIVSMGMIAQLTLNAENGGGIISPGYQSQVFADSLPVKSGEIWINLQSYLAGMLSNSIVPVFGPNILSAFDRFGLAVVPVWSNVLILLIIGLGLVLSLQHFHISDLYALLYFGGILAFWNPQVGSSQERFLIPLVPFLYCYFLRGLIWLARWIPSSGTRHARLAVVAVSSVVVMFSLARNVQEWQNPIRVRTTDLSAGTEWIRDNSPDASIIMARDPVPDYLYTRRKTVAYPENTWDIERTIDVNHVAYIIVSPKLETPRTGRLEEFTQRKLLPLLLADPDRFRLVYAESSSNVSVFRVITQ